MVNKLAALINKKQVCPTLEDIENKELKKLANQLRKDSNKETLTSILEWQDRNIQFWWARYPFPLCILFFIPFLFFPFSYLMISMELRVAIIGGIIFLYSLFYLGCLVTVALIQHLTSLREKKSKFIEVLYDTFRLGLPVDKILKYKLAVCRDYARLTSSLLFSIYPDSKLFFISIFGHVAVGITIKNKIYVLDQHLPILTIDKWLLARNKTEADCSISEIIRDSKKKPTNVTFSKPKKIDRNLKKEIPKIDDEKLKDIANILAKKQNLHEDKTKFKISLPNYAIYYDDDEIVKYSLTRGIKNKLDNELCDNIDKISNIEIIQDKKDFIIIVCI